MDQEIPGQENALPAETEPTGQASAAALARAQASHPRRFAAFRHAYPVISRRSHGVSLGVNLNLDKNCNFDCPYCQVDRRAPAGPQSIDVDLVEREVRALLEDWRTTRLSGLFPDIPEESRGLSDIALSGDGEPTLVPEFAAACERLSSIQRSWSTQGGASFRLVLITNATLLDREPVRAGLRALCRIDGEIWAKLDAGTQAHYQAMNASRVPLERIVANIAGVAAEFPVRIQSMFMEYHGEAPSTAEIDAYLARLRAIAAQGRPRGVQLYTVARPTSATGCRPLSAAWLEALGTRIADETGLEWEAFPGWESGAIGE